MSKNIDISFQLKVCIAIFDLVLYQCTVEVLSTDGTRDIILIDNVSTIKTNVLKYNTLFTIKKLEIDQFKSLDIFRSILRQD